MLAQWGLHHGPGCAGTRNACGSQCLQQVYGIQYCQKASYSSVESKIDGRDIAEGDSLGLDGELVGVSCAQALGCV
jgi:hypothetical protein